MKKENSVEGETKMEDIGMMEEELFDPYQGALNAEEEIVKRRTEKEDQERFSSICKQLRNIMKEILKLKTEKSDNWVAEVEERKLKGLMLMLSIRSLSRIQKVRVKDSRERSAEYRQGVDAVTLQLQNLLYEVSHLKKEVRKCLEFKSADEEIDLVSTDQFYKEAPSNISRPEETMEDPHQRRLAQLHWELEQRRGQTQLSDQLKKETEEAAATIQSQEEKLGSLLPRINAILEATEPLQKALNLPLDARREQQKVSELLPAPLYTLWVQATAYSEAYGGSLTGDSSPSTQQPPLMEVEILGDAEAAKGLISGGGRDPPSGSGMDDASDSDDGEREENTQRKKSGSSSAAGSRRIGGGGGGSSHKSRRTRSPLVGGGDHQHGRRHKGGDDEDNNYDDDYGESDSLRDGGDEATPGRQEMLALHPLRVAVTLRTKAGNAVIINFHYARTLRMITTKCSLLMAESDSSEEVLTDVLKSETLLTELFPGDSGAESPNPANEYQFRKMGMSGGIGSSSSSSSPPGNGHPLNQGGPGCGRLLLPEEDLRVIGRPYRWAQTLAGISFLTAELPANAVSPPSPSPPTTTYGVHRGGSRGGRGSPSSTHEGGADEDDTEGAEFAADMTRLQQQSQTGGPLSKRVTETLSWKVSAEHMHQIVSAIRRRIKARLALHTQFIKLESANSTSCIPLPSESLQNLFPGKVCSELRSWKPLTWGDYESSPSTKHLIDCGVVGPHHLLFKAVFDRRAVVLEAMVAVSMDYPNVAPVFGLTLKWGSQKDTALTNPHVRQMESEVNIHLSELASSRTERLDLLPLQLYRTAVCLDVLTEATCLQRESCPTPSSGSQFPKEKIFFRPARGPDRSLPLKYLPKLGVFAQR